MFGWNCPNRVLGRNIPQSTGCPSFWIKDSIHAGKRVQAERIGIREASALVQEKGSLNRVLNGNVLHQRAAQR